MQEARRGGPLRIGLLGLGTVGSQVAARLLARRQDMRSRTGVDLELARVLVRDPQRARPVALPEGLLTVDAEEVVGDPTIGVVVEVMGGEEPARSHIERAIRAGKHVVTANKVVMAKHGPSLLELAGHCNVDVYFEAAVGGGIPLISTFKIDLGANEIERVAAVINGTTNYVLGRMSADGISLDQAVAEAQAAGFAEADPTDDIGGYDAAYKLAILASIAFGARVSPDDVHREGIERLQAVDFRHARELGFEIKLVAYAARCDGGVEARVHPAMVPAHHPLARVEGAFNAVYIEGDLVGPVLLYGQGAGGRPTASAVIGDLVDLVHSIRRQVADRSPVHFDSGVRVVPIGQVRTAAYFRVLADDRPGVIAAMGEVLAEEDVSISSMIQKDAWAEEGSAELVITTHPARDAALARATERIAGLPPIRSLASFLRVL
jgi:homoserine dehydrogenase